MWQLDGFLSLKAASVLKALDSVLCLNTESLSVCLPQAVTAALFKHQDVERREEGGEPQIPCD